eukprot:PRCOL_00005364-RA
MIARAVDNPVGDQPPLRDKLRALKRDKDNPSVVFAFDDVSVPLPPMQSPDLRQLIMEYCEQVCVEEGVTDIKFISSIALHRFLRPDEFKHVCGKKLFNKYYPQGRMFNYNAIDAEHSKHLGKTRHGEDVEVCKEFAESDLAIYANVNYVPMDGGYKSYATGMVSYNSLRHNHDCDTLKKTKSLYDPKRSQLHKSFGRVGREMAKSIDIFHVETVVDENLFPWYMSWLSVLMRRMNFVQKLVARVTVFALRFIPLWLRMRVFWAIRAPFGLLEVNAGETEAVHERTLDACYKDKVLDVEGQAGILIIAPTALGPYTKDMYCNPLLVNTYALGYYYNMYVGGLPLLKEGGVAIVVNEMHYEWSEPAHTTYRELFEGVIAEHGDLDEFERFQDGFATNERLNDIYRAGKGPAGVHGFYMYTWAAHGMDSVSKVFCVGAKDRRGADVLKWECKDSVVDAVAAARDFLGDEKASVTYLQVPPVTYS